MRWILTALCVSIPQLAWASCVTVDAPAVPRAMRTGVAASLAFDAGATPSEYQNVSDGQGLQPGQSLLHDICYPTFDPTGIVTEQTMTDRYTSDEAARQSAALAEATRQAAFESEVTTNDLCSSELSALDAKIDTAIDAASNLTQLKTVLKVGLKKVVRCVRSRAR